MVHPPVVVILGNIPHGAVDLVVTVREPSALPAVPPQLRRWVRQALAFWMAVWRAAEVRQRDSHVVADEEPGGRVVEFVLCDDARNIE